MALSICPNRAVAFVCNVCRFLCPTTPAAVPYILEGTFQAVQIQGSYGETYCKLEEQNITSAVERELRLQNW